MENNTEDNMAVAINLLNNESSLNIGLVYPASNEQFLSQKSIVICLGDKPVLMMGWDGFESLVEVEQAALRLVASKDFSAIIAYMFNVPIDLESQQLDLNLKMMGNREVLQGASGKVAERYFTVVTSKKYHQGEGLIKAIPILDDPENTTFSFGLCVCNEVMKALLPDAKDMSGSIVPVPPAPQSASGE